jgi:Ca-activated chloride channel homolog
MGAPMKGMIRLFAIFAALATAVLFAVPASAFNPFLREDGDVADGNEQLAKGKFKEALSSYDEAAKKLPSRGEVHLNRGLALMRMADDKLDQAMQALKVASATESPPSVRARALASLGDAFSRKEDFESAIESYKKSLMTAPGNKDVAWNLELAIQKQKKKEEQKKKDQEKKDQQKDQQKQDQQKQDQQKQDQQKQDQQKQDQQKQDRQKQDQQKQDQQQQQQKQASQPKTQQEMEQMLDSLDRDQNNLAREQARRRAAAMPAVPIEDW